MVDFLKNIPKRLSEGYLENFLNMPLEEFIKKSLKDSLLKVPGEISDKSLKRILERISIVIPGEVSEGNLLNLLKLMGISVVSS